MVTSGLRNFRPTNETQRAMQVRQTFDETCAGIRSDPDLSDVGKRATMAAAWLKHSVTLAEIRATESDAIAARRAALENQLFTRPRWLGKRLRKARHMLSGLLSGGARSDWERER